MSREDGVRTTLSLLCIAAFLFIWGAPVCAHNGIEDIAVTVRQLGRGGAFIATEPDAGLEAAAVRAEPNDVGTRRNLGAAD